jgi:hypothetical protein
MKEKLNKDKENLRKRNQTEILEIKSSLNQIILFDYRGKPHQQNRTSGRQALWT